MPQRDVLAELRAARTAAPDEVRERVLTLAAAAAPPKRTTFTWRRALVVCVPVAAAVAAAVVLTRPSHPTAVHVTDYGTQTTPLSTRSAGADSVHGEALVVPSAKQRVQLVGTSLALRTRDISGGVKRAVQIATSLGGYAASVHADLSSAELTLKVPRTHLQEAMARLSQLGKITAENVQVTDETAGLNATDRRIARLQAQIAALRAQNAPTTKVEPLVARVKALQRSEAATRRAAHYATVDLSLATPQAAAPAHHRHGPLHGIGVALRWLGIGAVYALAVGGPVIVLLALLWLAARLVRRRRVDALLSRP
jgi:Domain of unknown function (DUF4349)